MNSNIADIKTIFGIPVVHQQLSLELHDKFVDYFANKIIYGVGSGRSYLLNANTTPSVDDDIAQRIITADFAPRLSTEPTKWHGKCRVCKGDFEVPLVEGIGPSSYCPECEHDAYLYADSFGGNTETILTRQRNELHRRVLEREASLINGIITINY